MAESEEPLDYSRHPGHGPRGELAAWARRSMTTSPTRTTMPIPFLIEFGDEAAAAELQRAAAMREGNAGNGTLVVAFRRRAIREGRARSLRPSPRWNGSSGCSTELDSPRRFRTANKRIVLSSPVPLPPEFLELFPDFPSIPRLQ